MRDWRRSVQGPEIPGFTSAVKNWLADCPAIKADRIYFNYLSAGDESQSFQTVEHSTVTEDIVGNEIGKYIFAIIDFRALSKMPLGRSEKDLAKAARVEEINAWIKSQCKLRNFPEFKGCTVEDLRVSPAPIFAGQEHTEGMILAKYMVQIEIDYIKYDTEGSERTPECDCDTERGIEFF